MRNLWRRLLAEIQEVKVKLKRSSLFAVSGSESFDCLLFCKLGEVWYSKWIKSLKISKKIFKNVFIPFIYLSINPSGEIYLTLNITIRNTDCASEKCPDRMDLFRTFNIRNIWLRLTNKHRLLVLHPHAGVDVLPPAWAQLYNIPRRAQLSEDATVSPVEKWKQLLRTFSEKRNFSLRAEKKNKNFV